MPSLAQQLRGGAVAMTDTRVGNEASMVRMFRAMAERVEAGEPWRDVLADYGLRIEGATEETLREALELPLLFHAGGPWTQEKRARWKAITGSDEATTKVMCEAIRALLTPTFGAGKP